MKLELKHLANYLPYGLKGYISEPIYVEDIAHEMDFSYVIDSGVIEILGCTKETSFQSECMFFRMGSGKDKRDGYISFEEDVKLLLRPLSDLTKPCLEGGKVPLMELCKITYDNHKNFRQRGNVIEILSGEYALYNFYWQKNGFVTIHISDKMARVIPNQIDLFSYLFKNHFDIYNLIQNGLAIDINTIKEEK